MQDYSYLTKTANDWMVMSYGDLGGFAGAGARVSHYKFYSPKLKRHVNTLFMEVGFGGGASAKIPEINTIISGINSLVKGKEGLTAESNYKKLECHVSFSIADIVGATGDCESGALILGDGPKYVRISVNGNGSGPAGSSKLFTLPVTFLGEKAYGVDASASLTVGYFLGVGQQFAGYNMQQKYFTEKAVRKNASDPLIMSHFGSMK